MLLIALRHIIFECCIKIVFNNITSNFIDINNSRTRLLLEYYTLWKQYDNILGNPTPNIYRTYDEFLVTMDGISLHMIKQEVIMLKSILQIYESI